MHDGGALKYDDVGIQVRFNLNKATMRLSGVRKIATHDRAFLTVEGIEIIDSIPRRTSLVRGDPPVQHASLVCEMPGGGA